MRIAILMEDTSRTGGIRALVEMANGLTARGHQCVFVLPRGVRGIPFTTCAQTMRVGPRLPPVRNVRNLINMFLLSWLVPEVDIVIASSWRSSFATYLSTRNKDRVGVYFVQADERLLLPDTVLGLLKRGVVERAYRLPLYKLTNSVWLRDRIRSEFDLRSEVVNPGVNVEVFSPIVKTDRNRSVSQPRTIVSVGRSLPIKGLPDLVESLHSVATEIPIRLVLISPEQLTVEASFPVQIVSPQSDEQLAGFYRSADVFVYSSWYEGFGLPPLEAMACGTPVVTTDCGGIREYAVDGTNCLIVPIQDPLALTKAILRLLRDPALGAHISANGVETASRFTWDVFAGSVEKALLGMIAA